MVSYVRDRVCETTTTTGTGNITVAGAITGYRTFEDAGAAGGDSFYYLIEAVDSNGVATGQWETGIGYFPTTTTISRVAPLDGSDGLATAVDFAAGTKRVHLTAPAYQLRWNGAVAYRSTNLTAQNYTTATAIAWDGTSPDVDAIFGSTAATTSNGFYDPGNTTRITVPPDGYNAGTFDLFAQVSLQNITVGDWVELKFRANGTTIIGRQTFYIARTTPALQVRCAQPVMMYGGEYVELMIQVGTDTSIDVLAADTFFAIEAKQ